MTSIVLDTTDTETAECLATLATRLSDHATRLQEISALLSRGEHSQVLYWAQNEIIEGVVGDLIHFHGDDAVEFGLQLKALIDRD
jgi:hypothetical protein